MRIVAVVVVVGFVVACGAPAAPPATPEGQGAEATVSPSTDDSACEKDDDCVATGFAGCCACAKAPYGTSRAWIEKQTAACAAAACLKPEGCAVVESPEAYRGECRAKRCVLERRTSARNDGS